MRLFRVFPWLESASGGESGHPLYTYPIQGGGRIDNPDLYLTLYAADSAAAAVGEKWGNHGVWTDALLEGIRSLPGSQTALASLELEGSVLDLDDPAVLHERSLHPSRVVIRDLGTTQRWARDIFLEESWDGIRWWSRHDSRWGAFGIWQIERISLVNVELLDRDHPAVSEAAETLMRPWA